MTPYNDQNLQQVKFPWSSSLKSVTNSLKLSVWNITFWSVEAHTSELSPTVCLFFLLGTPVFYECHLILQPNIINLLICLFSKMCWLSPGIPHFWTTGKKKVARTEILTVRHFNLELCPILCLVAQLCLTLCDPMDRSPPGSSVRGDSLGKNTGMGCHALLQGIFPTWDRTLVSHIAGRFFTV